MSEHLLDEDSIPSCGILHQHVSYRPHQLAVLNDGASAHPLNDPACQRQKLLVRNLYDDSSVHIIPFQIHFHDLHIIEFRHTCHGTDDLCRPQFDLLL